MDDKNTGELPEKRQAVNPDEPPLQKMNDKKAGKLPEKRQAVNLFDSPSKFEFNVPVSAAAKMRMDSFINRRSPPRRQSFRLLTEDREKIESSVEKLEQDSVSLPCWLKLNERSGEESAVKGQTDENWKNKRKWSDVPPSSPRPTNKIGVVVLAILFILRFRKRRDCFSSQEKRSDLFSSKEKRMDLSEEWDPSDLTFSETNRCSFSSQSEVSYQVSDEGSGEESVEKGQTNENRKNKRKWSDVPLSSPMPTNKIGVVFLAILFILRVSKRKDRFSSKEKRRDIFSSKEKRMDLSEECDPFDLTFSWLDHQMLQIENQMNMRKWSDIPQSSPRPTNKIWVVVLVILFISRVSKRRDRFSSQEKRRDLFSSKEKRMDLSDEWNPFDLTFSETNRSTFSSLESAESAGVHQVVSKTRDLFSSKEKRIGFSDERDPSDLTFSETNRCTFSSLESAETEGSHQVFDEMLLQPRPTKSIMVVILAILFISRVRRRMALATDDPIILDMGSDLSPPTPKCDLNSSDTNFSTFDGSIGDDALLYCALFPPDYEFDRDTLVQLWMAVGFFLEEPMERVADQLFEDYLTKGYLQFSRTNLLTGNAMYKFTGDSQLLPRLTSRADHIVRIEGSSNLSVISPEVSHVSVTCSPVKDTTTLHGYQRFKHLKTLILLEGHQMSFKQVPRDFFVSLTQLRVLDLSKTRLMELPSSIGNMKCLCFLDLSNTLIKRLPEAIVCLKKLQTLKLRGCTNLTTLPTGTRKLVNLRHLDFDVLRQLLSMPEWMGDLTNIRTLSAFLVGVEEGCSIGQLKHMDNLSGSFCISRLENVSTDEEAVEACLSIKAHLKKLKLHWTNSQDEDIVEYGKVLNSLQPNKSLEELNISCYSGFELPSWICNPEFTELVSITLFECERCSILPSLGQLPSLKYLNLVGFHNLRAIDDEFYGGSGVEGYVAFPKLQKLAIEDMFSLEEWSGIISFAFPRLLNLTVKHCPKLHNLCTLSSLCSLEKLEISHCAMLASFSADKVPAWVNTFIIEDCPLISVRFLNGDQDRQRVANIPHIWIDHKEISYG